MCLSNFHSSITNYSQYAGNADDKFPQEALIFCYNALLVALLSLSLQSAIDS